MHISSSDQNAQIDIVYTWVNGNAPGYQALVHKYARTDSDVNPERYRDIYSLLKYSLRSVELFAQWIGNIYIFTCRPQIPEWLNSAHPRVKIIHHDELIDNEFLPTFSCNVIESYLDKIPTQSDYILYLNDDFLFGHNTSKDDFLTNDGRIKIYGSLIGERCKYLVYDGRYNFISLGFIEHMPYLIYKPFWREMLTLKEHELLQTRKNKFRNDDDIKMDKLYHYFLLSQKREHIKVVSYFKSYKLSTFHKITNDFKKQEYLLKNIVKKQPKFICLNDDQEINPNTKVNDLVINFLENYYPAPSSFEKSHAKK